MGEDASAQSVLDTSEKAVEEPVMTEEKQDVVPADEVLAVSVKACQVPAFCLDKLLCNVAKVDSGVSKLLAAGYTVTKTEESLLLGADFAAQVIMVRAFLEAASEM